MELGAPDRCIIRESESKSLPHHFGETGSKSDHRSALDVVVVLEVLDGATELELLQSKSSKEPGDQRNKNEPHFDDKPSSNRPNVCKMNTTKGLFKKQNNQFKITIYVMTLIATLIQCITNTSVTSCCRWLDSMIGGSR